MTLLAPVLAAAGGVAHARADDRHEARVAASMQEQGERELSADCLLRILLGMKCEE